MQIFLVGGAVRDQLLGYPVHEKDWVVVGGSAEQLLDQGFKQVGKDFPVFLHPQTQDEYALARTERKSGHGYTGFECYSAADVTLEQDLLRRDLTINAMALDCEGNLHDPYNGQQDLDNRLLRHVSDAFIEDPLRVLRVARFAARYHHMGFRVADETLQLMTEMSHSGELNSLVAERVWKETERALSGRNPEIYISLLHQCGALSVILPEVDALFGVPQPEKHHPEIDTGLHTLMALQACCELTDEPATRFATLVHDIGKGTTPKGEWPRHIAHEHRGNKMIEPLCQRLRIPKHMQQLAMLVAEYHTHCHRALELKALTVVKLLRQTDALRRRDRFEQFLLACTADARGRKGKQHDAYPQADYLRQCLTAITAISPQRLIEQGYSGQQLGEQLAKQQLSAVSKIKNKLGSNIE